MNPNNCPACQSTNQPGAHFCANCGRQLTGSAPVTHVLNAHSCPTCNSPLRAGARFCANCGTSLTSAKTSQATGAKACPHCKSSNAANATLCATCNKLFAGHVLEGRYDVQKMLGEGGFGAVYLAQDIRLKRQCVVKQMLLPEKPHQSQYLPPSSCAVAKQCQ